MDTALRTRRLTRRECLLAAARLGVGAVTLSMVGYGSTAPAYAAGPRSERVQVLMEDHAESTATDFARGRARGVAIVSEAGRAVLRSEDRGEYTSGVTEFRLPPTHLGLHWVARNAPDHLMVEVRTSPDNLGWSPWQSLSLEAVQDSAAGREAFAALVSGNRERFVQYRVQFPSNEVATLSSLSITAINSADGPRETVAATRTSMPFQSPHASFAVITREGWGCDERLRWRGSRETWPEMYVPAKKVVIHHTATTNDYTNGAAEVRAIYTYHTRTLGWGDIGYNVLVDRSGKIYEGRHGRGEDSGTREIMSADVVAGHVYNHNYGSTGIAAIGDFDQAQPAEVLKAVEGAIDELTTFECWRHYIHPYGQASFLRSDNQWHDGLNNISGHYESYDTSCPGAVLTDYLAMLRDHVSARLGLASAPSWNITPASREAVEPVDMSFSWSAGNVDCEYCLEGWYKPSNSYDITYLTGYEPGGYGDSLAKAQEWRAAGSTSLAFPNLAAGHYNMHVRAASGVHEANFSFLVKKAASTKPGRPGRGQRI